MWGKAICERTFSSVNTLFCQYVAGYTGSDVTRRGRDVAAEAVWTLPQLQDLLDEWIVAGWQNRPHEGLRSPYLPGRELTPNEAYAVQVARAGYLPVPLAGEDYIELLPACWRAINDYGLVIGHRTYDCPELGPYRRKPSPVAAMRGRWEVHYDPYDLSRVWVRDQAGGGWITVFWKHLSTAPVPFGELAWDHARRQLAGDGRNPAEQEIVRAVQSLLQQAHQGPGKPGRPGRKTAKDRRVAARTTATAQPAWPRPEAPAGSGDPAAIPDEPPGPPEDKLADVVPLAVFDAREEARRWW